MGSANVPSRSGAQKLVCTHYMRGCAVLDAILAYLGRRFLYQELSQGSPPSNSNHTVGVCCVSTPAVEAHSQKMCKLTCRPMYKEQHKTLSVLTSPSIVSAGVYVLLLPMSRMNQVFVTGYLKLTFGVSACGRSSRAGSLVSSLLTRPH